MHSGTTTRNKISQMVGLRQNMELPWGQSPEGQTFKHCKYPDHEVETW